MFIRYIGYFFVTNCFLVETSCYLIILTSNSGANKRDLQVKSAIVVQCSSEACLLEFGSIIVDIFFCQPRRKVFWRWDGAKSVFFRQTRSLCTSIR